MNNRIIESDIKVTFYQCSECKFKFHKSKGCEAFPEKIPLSLATGAIPHDKKMFDQKNDVVFEKEK